MGSSDTVMVGRKDEGLYIIGINKLCPGRSCSDGTFCHIFSVGFFGSEVGLKFLNS